MSDRQPAPHGGQYKPRTSSVQMEDRNVLRRMERERRSQEVQPEETQYDRITPLFNKPYKRIKDDELSSRIQKMLGNYEDGCDGPEDPALPHERSSQSGPTDGPRAIPGPALGESWVSFPALSPPVEPLSPLMSSDSDTGPSPERRRPDAPSLSLHSTLPNAKKPTAYVRPWEGSPELTSSSPDLKTSLESYEDLQDLKESSKPNLAPLQAAGIVSRASVEDILQEMTSWPPLLTTICSPSTAEPPKVLSTNEETHGLPALEVHKSSDKVQLVSQGGSSNTSDSDTSSDTDSEKSSGPDEPAASETIQTHVHTHTETPKQLKKESDWQLGRWLERKENQHQQNPRSPCDVIRPNSHDSSERTEAPGAQTCHSVPADDGKASDHRQTVESTCEENTSTHRPTQQRKKRALHTEQKRTTADSKHPPLLVKIGLNLLSRIPQEPKDTQPQAENSKASRRKRAMETDEKPSKKKQKLDKEKNDRLPLSRASN
ncbi:AF4/FMR2 family member 1 isoform X2 [Puntigrus tetrazona]|uniref:AF4/FMR2 family member 1 isoform X2 n=1 Tax=Puntigrus tetrazona TaxID=1606681 RepID=UPI001C895F87|nr:AF4/FMR2 family member 1 isoform X2 [Puntigrus tetrazona]